MTAPLFLATWSASRLGEALEALARASKLSVEPGLDRHGPPPRAEVDDQGFEAWMRAVADSMHCEVEPVEVRHAEIAAFLARAGPALLLLPVENERRVLAIVDGGARSLRVLGPDLGFHRVRLDVVTTALREPHGAAAGAEIEELLERARVPARRRECARERLLDEQVGSIRVTGCWLVRAAPSRGVRGLLGESRLPAVLTVFLAAQTVHDVLWALSWWIVGRGVLEGRLDWGWLVAWALLLVTLAPWQALATWSQGLLSVGTAGLLKQRLLEGALRTEPDEVRHQGIGHLLGRVLESEAVESLGQSGGFLALVGVVELAIAGLALAFGADGPVHVFLLVVWLALGLAIAWRYARQQRAWTETRLRMTHDLVERMVGHRTRLAQEDFAGRHDGEDQALARYLDVSRAMDRMGSILEGALPRGWLVLGLAWLGYRFLSGAVSPVTLALTLAGVLLAQRAMARLAMSATHVVGAMVAWKQVAPLFHAATRREFAPASVGARRPDRQAPVLEARKIVFRHGDRLEPVLSGCDLRVYPGDRILLHGASGSGKSTLASILGGLRAPRSGLVLCHGLDRQSLGADGWRRQVAVAPQFQENYIFAGTLAFNLLIGRRWPPRPEDLEEAEAICRELGLGALLERMPAGLDQLVGETGWQLSHGERSRVYVARALLQNANLVVLDESFAELDADTLRRCLACVAKRAASLLVIAHG